MTPFSGIEDLNVKFDLEDFKSLIKTSDESQTQVQVTIDSLLSTFSTFYSTKGGHLETLLLLFFFVLRLYFQDSVQKTDFYTFFS